MKKLITCSLIFSLWAGSCMAADSGSLMQELQGKPVEQQHEALRLACLNRAEKVTGKTTLWKKNVHGHTPIHDSKVEQLKQVCREMSEAFVAPQHDMARLAPAAGGHNPPASKLQLLSKECSARLNRLSDEGSPKEGIDPMREVCRAMSAVPY